MLCFENASTQYKYLKIRIISLGQHLYYCLNINPEDVRGNMKFCMNPVPGVKGLKNFNHSFTHNFILVRLGGRRMNFLCEDDFLQLNNILRIMP